MTLYDGLKEIFEQDGYHNGFEKIIFFKLNPIKGRNDLVFYEINASVIDLFKNLKLEYEDTLEYGKIFIIMDDNTWYDVEYQGIDTLVHRIPPDANILRKEYKQSTQIEIKDFKTINMVEDFNI